jgi:hypothetical protein
MRTEIALALDEPLAHRPRLRHVDERRINHRFAVRMVIAAGVAADFRALVRLASGEQRQLVHRVKDAALRRFQAVAHIGQRARDDDGHGIVEERILDFVRDVDLRDFFVRGEQRRVAHGQIIRVFGFSHKNFRAKN